MSEAFLSHVFYLKAKLALLLCLWTAGALAGGPGGCVSVAVVSPPLPSHCVGFSAFHLWKGCPVTELLGLCPGHVREMMSKT